MTRFEFALQAASGPHMVSLADLSGALASAVAHIEAEGGTVERDPAVLLIGSFIGFHTHMDCNTAGGYRKLITLCEDQVAAQPLEFQ